jgi:hypothetical protein
MYFAPVIFKKFLASDMVEIQANQSINPPLDLRALAD